MYGKITPRSSLDALKREAKRWLAALRANDTSALKRFQGALRGSRTAWPGDSPVEAKLRHVQLALAREYGFAGWSELKAHIIAGAHLGPFPDAQSSDVTERKLLIATLLGAVDRNDVDSVIALLDANPDVASERGVLAGHTGLRSALHFAVAHSNEQMVRALLERGADPNVRDEGDNAMPLHFAAEKEHLPIIKWLIEFGADPIGAGDYHLLDVIGWATCFGTAKAEVMNYLLEHGSRHNMSSATAVGAVDAIRSLVAEAPAVLNARMDKANALRTPLHLAILKKQPASLATLLELGAETELPDAAGLTPLDQAAIDNEPAMADALIARGATLHLPAAIALRKHDEAFRLLSESPDALKPGGPWSGLLIRAAERSRGDVIQSIIRAGADVNAVGDTNTSVDSTRGYTALHAAAFHGNADAASVLVRSGANVRARDEIYSATPAGWADYKGHEEVRDFILSRDIDVFDAISFNLAHRLDDILRRDPEATNRRFAQYAPLGVEESFDREMTPLMHAVKEGRFEMLPALLKRGADATLSDSKGRTALDFVPENHRDAFGAQLAHESARAQDAESAETDSARENLVVKFLENACLDWRVDGSARAARMHDAARLLTRRPEIAGENILTAIASGNRTYFDQYLATAAKPVPGGPRNWTPLLYLASARLPDAAASEHSVHFAQQLLGTISSAGEFYYGGNEKIRYTAITCVMGQGEEQASTHPHAKELIDLLLQHGADLYDTQLMYNVFADHASRKNVTDDLVWLLEAIYGHARLRGRANDWNDPMWSMIDMGGYGNGAHFLLTAAIDTNSLQLAEWMLQHGASPNAVIPAQMKFKSPALYEQAVHKHRYEMVALLERYGATPATRKHDAHDEFVDACFQVDVARIRTLIHTYPEFRDDHRALFAAAEQNRADVVAMLLDLGVAARIEHADGGHSTALHAAAYSGSIDAARVLIERGAEVDARENHYDAIPLGMANWSQQHRMVTFLAQYSRDIWELVYTGQVKRVRELLGENPELAMTVSSNGATPLMWLPNNEHDALAIVRMFLDNGANGAQADLSGKTAADVARDRSMYDVASLLDETA